MKAILVKAHGGPEVLHLQEVPDPVPGPSEVLIEVTGASVNFADIKARSGSYHLGKQPPFVPGIDCSGIVRSVGSSVTNFTPDDRVIAFCSSGTYAEFACADERLCFHLPPAIDLVAAAAFPLAAGAAMHMLTDIAKLQPGERVLIHGASGGVGSVAVAIARMIGSSFIAATSGNPDKRAFLEHIGVDLVLDLKDGAYRYDTPHARPGAGFDIVLNPIGGALLLSDLDNLNGFGRIVLYGEMAGQDSTIPPEALYTQNKSILGFSFGHTRKFHPETISGTMQHIIAAVAAQKLSVPIHGFYPLQDASIVHNLIEQRKVTGKTVLLPH